MTPWDRRMYPSSAKRLSARFTFSLLAPTMPASVRWLRGISMMIPPEVGRPFDSANSTSFSATRAGMSRNAISPIAASFRLI